MKRSSYQWFLIPALATAIIFTGCSGGGASISHSSGSSYSALPPITTPAPKPAEFVIGQISIPAQQIKAKVVTTTNVVVTNSGETAGSYSAVLKANGNDVQSQSIQLSPGESKTVQFTYSLAQAGDYTISVGDKTAALKVLPLTETLEVVFTSFLLTSNDESLCIINGDGTGYKKLTTETGVIEHFGSLSPDGQKIVFGRYDGSMFSIASMNKDGTARARLTISGLDDMPSWSPDGKFICFMSGRDGNKEIYVMGADGSAQTRLTNDPANDWMPIWSPDSSKIAFMSDRGGSWRWWVMNADGTNQRLIADVVVFDNSPFPVVLLRGCWTKDYFFVPVLTTNAEKVITLDVAQGKPGNLTLADIVCIAADGTSWIGCGYYSDTKSLDLTVIWASTRLTHSPEWEVPNSCATVYQ